MKKSTKKGILIGIFALLALVVLYVWAENSESVQAQKQAKIEAEENRHYRDIGNSIKNYISENMPAAALRLLADNRPYTVLVSHGEASVSFRVLFDFGIPYVAEMMIPVVQSALEIEEIPLESLVIACYSESNQNGMDTDTLVRWSTHDFESGTFLSAPDNNYMMSNATVHDLKSYYAKDAEIVNRLLNETTLHFSFGDRTGIYNGETNENGLPDGYGTFESENATGLSWVYEGDWVNGHWSGTGRSTFSDGTMYEGEYSMDMENGVGVYIAADGIRYEGTFVSGSFVGGTVYFSDGSYFVGEYNGEDVATGIYYDVNQNPSDAQFHEGNITLTGKETHGQSAESISDSSSEPELQIESAFEPEAMEYSYVLNTNTKKFHKPSCKNVSNIKEKNRKDYTGSRESLIEQGYSPCSHCNP